MTHPRLLVGLLVCVPCVVSMGGCSGATPEAATPGAEATAPETFTFAPTLDKRLKYQQRRFQEVSVPGSPMRNMEEWVIDWEVITKAETNLFRRLLHLVGMKMSVNGLEILRGDEVRERLAAIEVLTDKDANVVDIRGTEEVSEALVALAPDEGKEAMARLFSPANLKGLALMRSRELNSDFVGKPTAVGSQWMANTPGEAGTRSIRVAREEPCDTNTCLRVVREYDVDRNEIQRVAAAQVAAYVASQGADPEQVQVQGMDLEHEDTLLIDPRTMQLYDAKFDQNATLQIMTPKGQLQVAFKLERTWAYQH